MIQNLQGALGGTATIFIFLAFGLIGAAATAHELEAHRASKAFTVSGIVIFTLSLIGYLAAIWIGVPA